MSYIYLFVRLDGAGDGAVTDPCPSLAEAIALKEPGPLLEKLRDHNDFTYVHSMRHTALMTLFARTIGRPTQASPKKN